MRDFWHPHRSNATAPHFAVLSYRRIAHCSASILEQGWKEMPTIPKRSKARRGSIARSDAHNLHARRVAQRENVLRFTRSADTLFSK